MAELRGYSPAGLLVPEDLAEGTGVRRLFVLMDPEYYAPEVTASGRRAEGCLWAYTTVPLLVESCGSGQPYVTLTPAQIAELAAAVGGAFLVAVDMWHPEGARYPELEPAEMEPLEPTEPTQIGDPLVWIPTRPVRSGDRRVSVELYGTRPGEQLLLAFDSPEQAWQACGPYQPLSAIHVDDLQAVAAECGAQQIVVGGVLSEDAQHKGPVQDWSRGTSSNSRVRQSPHMGG